MVPTLGNIRQFLRMKKGDAREAKAARLIADGPLPFRFGSNTTEIGCPLDVRFPPDSDRTGDVARPAQLVRSVSKGDIVLLLETNEATN